MSIQQNYGNIKPSLNLDFANTKQLDPRITYSRASTGTYYDGKTAAKAEENLLTYSQEFVNWTEANGCTVTADSTAAPDGTTTADLLIPSTASLSYHVRTSNSFTTQAASILSVYVKPSGYNYLSVVVSSNTGRANIEVSTGSITNYGTNAFTVNSIALANGWYRLVITVPVAFSAANVWLGPNSAVRDPLAIWAGDGTSGAYLWGAQLEQRSFATAYTPTTTAPITNYIPVLQTASAGTPRFDHNPITGESLGLLIEEQRTNLLLRSEEFDNAAWTKISTTITANTIVAPDGTLTGDKLASSTVSVASHQDYQIGITITNAATYTWSVYMKQGEYAWGIVNAYSATDSRTYFNLATGTVGTVAAGSTATITPVGNGWYRCSVTRTSAASTGGLSIEMTNADNVPSFAAIVGNGIYIWGAQLETGAFATSYIPTVASQVTRAADNAVMTGTNFSSWYNQSEGSFYFNATTASVGNRGLFFATNNANTADRMFSYGSVTALVFAGNTSVANQFTLIQVPGSLSNASALAYKVNDFAATSNGVAVATDTSGSVPLGINQIQFGYLTNSNDQNINGTIKKLAYYPRRLTNTQIQALTT